MLEILVKQEPGFSAAISEGGLYAEIAEEAREYFGPGADIALVCGRDAAERIAAWDYGSPGFFDDFVRQYKLLVAARAGEYEPAAHHRQQMMRLPMESSWTTYRPRKYAAALPRVRTGVRWCHPLSPVSSRPYIEQALY